MSNSQLNVVILFCLKFYWKLNDLKQKQLDAQIISSISNEVAPMILKMEVILNLLRIY